jgi:hypothetical protein
MSPVTGPLCVWLALIRSFACDAVAAPDRLRHPRDKRGRHAEQVEGHQDGPRAALVGKGQGLGVQSQSHPFGCARTDAVAGHPDSGRGRDVHGGDAGPPAGGGPGDQAGAGGHPREEVAPLHV